MNKKLAAVILALAAATALAQESPRGVGANPASRPGMSSRPASETAATPASPDKLSVTHAQITVDGQPLSYTATAGYMPLKDDTGKLRANIFYVAYTKSPAKEGASETAGDATRAAAEAASQPAPVESIPNRPLTFVFNGGPGAAAAWLHLGTAGPYRVDVPPGTDSPTPPGKLVENPFTWLTATDLVFIDPVGTGYSRAATPEQNKEFYNVSEDVASVAEFIRLYTTHNQRWESPKFLAGESYGTTRAAALAEHLHDTTGLALNGVILISTVLNFATLRPQEGNDLPYALYLPSYTATAFFHKKLAADLEKDLAQTLTDAKTFAGGPYLEALDKGSRLPATERATIIDQLARFTGLPKEYITKANLRIDPDRFEQTLLNNEPEPRLIGRMDSRLTGFTANAASNEPDFDPAVSSFLPLYTAAFNAYVRGQLKYENDLSYELLSGRVGPWNFGGNGSTGFLYVGDNLRNAMQKNPHLKLLVCQGYFDLATPFFATDYTIAHLNLPAPLRANITQAYYPAGHMVYHERSSLEKLHADIARFIEAAVGDH